MNSNLIHQRHLWLIQLNPYAALLLLIFIGEVNSLTGTLPQQVLCPTTLTSTEQSAVNAVAV